ncbi:MAG: PHP domain-containing protein [Lachnospiraceae bacterium]|nr:PHP domain-containing protein [Lachnospiraceae bacterium]
MAYIDDYPYLYETHMHTSQASKCADSTGREMAEAAKAAGYAGVIITDHSWYGNNCIDSSLPWEQWIGMFGKGYEDAKRWGDENDFSVFFGYEANYDATEFLIYGVDIEWLTAHPQIKTASVKEQYEMIHSAGGLVIHAHPFREAGYISEIRLFPEYVDGVEAVNATHSCHLSVHHNNPEFDVRARAYAREHHLPMTAGSDVHSTHILGGGMAFKRKLESIQDYCNAILTGEDYLMTNGETWFDPNGFPIEG